MKKIVALMGTIVGLIIYFIVLFSCKNTVNAAECAGYQSSWSLNGTYTVGASHVARYCVSGHWHKLMCIEHGRSIWNHPYKVEEHFKIEGRKAYSVRLGRWSSAHNSNAIMAYITENGFHRYDAYDVGEAYNPQQIALWDYFDTWNNFLQGEGLMAKKWREYNNSGTETNSDSRAVLERARAYAAQAKNVESEIVNKTANPKVNINSDGYLYVGPIKWEFGGTINDVSIKDRSGNAISASICIVNGNSYQSIAANRISSNSNFYIKLKPVDGRQKITVKATKKGTVKTANIWLATDKNGCDEGGCQNVLRHSTSSTTITKESTFSYNLTANLRIIKQDFYDSNKKLNGVKFKIYNSDLRRYVASNGTDSTYAKYTDKESEAAVFRTNVDGTFLVRNLLVGNYQAKEIDINENENYGYVMSPNPVEIKVIYDGSTRTVEKPIKNKQEYIKLGGFVWLEDARNAGKDQRVFKSNGIYSSSNDIMFNDKSKPVTVRLIDSSTGKVVTGYKDNAQLIADTNNSSGSNYKFSNGYYEFSDVPLGEKGKDLQKYYIEFSYDGLIYTAVKPQQSNSTQKANNSKAQEMATGRSNIDLQYSTIYGKKDKGNIDYVTKGYAKGNSEKNLTYTRQSNKASINHDQFGASNYIFARTNTGNDPTYSYSLFDLYYLGLTKINYINLGLVKRETPKISVDSDIESAKISINEKENVYKYNKRKGYLQFTEGVGVGVKFGNEYTNEYTRAIYPSDISYNPGDNRELKIDITYKIAITNVSSNLDMVVNEFVNYHDIKANIISAVLKNSSGEVIKNSENKPVTVSYKPEGLYGNKYGNDKYKASYLKTSEAIRIPSLNSGKSNKVYIYLTLQMNRKTIKECLEGDGVVDNIIEVNSYSTYATNTTFLTASTTTKNGRYGIIDFESAAGNAIPGEKSTYESDTDQSPGLKIEKVGERKIEGTTFLDFTNPELLTEKIREGNGIYNTNEGDVPLKEVQIKIKENRKDSKPCVIYEKRKKSQEGYQELLYRGKDQNGNTVYIDQNGNTYSKEDSRIEDIVSSEESGAYGLKAFLPGDYKIEYTWGDNSYTTNLQGEKEERSVQEYKATIYKDRDRQENPEWYKDISIRYSDALDDIGVRKEIDTEIATINANTKITKKKMTSRTPIMAIGVEYNPTTEDSIGKSYEYLIKNVDFGIVERARQNITLQKVVDYIKITLANGQILLEGKPGQPGENLPGVQYVEREYSEQTETDGTKLFEKIKIEMDNEIIHGSTLEVRYKFIISNNGEIDYNLVNSAGKYVLEGIDFYHYGLEGKQLNEEYIVRVTQATLLDYIDNKVSVESEELTGRKETGWIAVNMSEENEKEVIKQLLLKKEQDASEINSDLEDEINKHNTIVYTTSIRSEQGSRGLDMIPHILPGKTDETTLTVKKVLTNGSELVFNNTSEIVEVEKTGGSDLWKQEIGGYLIGRGIGEVAPEIPITPPTGQKRIYYAITITSLLVMTGGIVLIKKKVLK